MTEAEPMPGWAREAMEEMLRNIGKQPPQPPPFSPEELGKVVALLALRDRPPHGSQAWMSQMADAVPRLLATLATARAEGRREGLEEAAKVCDEAVCQHEHDARRDDGLILPEWLRTKAEKARQLAKSIRALNAKEPTG